METIEEREERERAQKAMWAMNCVLFGAETYKELKEGEEEKVREKLKTLTSVLRPEDADYLFFRLVEILNETD